MSKTVAALAVAKAASRGIPTVLLLHRHLLGVGQVMVLGGLRALGLRRARLEGNYLND